MKIASTILLISSALASIAAVDDSTSIFEVLDSFREPKNIAFSALMGGSSHNVWVLSILNELATNRGHKAFFVTRDDQMKFGKNYPSIEVVSVGPKYNFGGEQIDIMKNMRERPPIESFIKMINSTGSEFETDYLGLVENFKAKEVDLAVCDHFNSPCFEAATTLKIPFIVTSSRALSPDAGAPYINNAIVNMEEPTTLNLSLWQRFDNMFIKPTQFMYQLRHFIKKKNVLYKSLGIADPVYAPEMRWKDSLKICNTAFGFDMARPLGPLVEFVGPIVTSFAPSLTSELDQYFKTHKKVAYIAFGQHAIPFTHDVELLMTGLLEAYETQELDGIIWATRGLEDIFPDQLTTQSNTTYNVQSFFENNNKKDIKFINWAPQIAILNHPSTSLFITHGGSGSLYESLNAGVRVVVLPFFGDQPGSAQIAQRNGVGLKLDYKVSQQKATEIIKTVARDDGNYFQTNANRFKAIVQLNSKFGIIRAANLIEEVLFTHQNGQLLHRRDVKRDMSFVKANNLDLYAIIATVVLASLFMLVQLVRKTFKSYRLNQKLKTN